MRTLGFLCLFALTVPAVASQPRTVGTETVIPFASGGGLRDWQRGGIVSDTLYVRDRTEQWYKVRLTAKCRFYGPLDALNYTTDVTGTFDTFSRLSVSGAPGQVCGISSIQTSLPPKGHQGRRPKA